MPTTLTPIIDDTPSSPPTYNVGIAETFSWIPIHNSERPLFARAMYLTNPNEIVLSVSSMSVTVSSLETLVSESNTLLGALTSCCAGGHSEIITLLHSITSASFQISLSTDQLESLVDNVETLLTNLTSSMDGVESLLVELTSSNVNIPGFSIPPYTEIDIQYYSPTNNVKQVNYLNGLTNVMSLSFSYLINPPVVDDSLLVNVKKI